MSCVHSFSAERALRNPGGWEMGQTHTHTQLTLPSSLGMHLSRLRAPDAASLASSRALARNDRSNLLSSSSEKGSLAPRGARASNASTAQKRGGGHASRRHGGESAGVSTDLTSKVRFHGGAVGPKRNERMKARRIPQRSLSISSQNDCPVFF
ncbi:hypothetical protein CDEST_03131 [Colletotrichum destructivum]|uniref:Uncharacterized protein n=1 Tax=Colletotrichum destructivum TaxID=34406 RepID=A0AAX4I404_9PEZI|nr:hypothetical protein CDEST_03131 [Colletotrichum destructivum]